MMTQRERNDAWFNCTCARCGRKFHKCPAKTKRAAEHFCSKECRFPNWKQSIGLKAPRNTTKTERPENNNPLCTLGQTCICTFDETSDQCQHCGFYLPEKQRREKLKYAKGPDGTLHINVGKGEVETG